MAVNKVIYDGSTLVDLTGDTVTANDLVIGITAHDKGGSAITGGNPYAKAETDAAKAAIEAAIEEKGVDVPEGTTLAEMAAAIAAIEAGGGVPEGFSAFEVIDWTPSADTQATSSGVRIPHSLGIQPDGFYMATTKQLELPTEAGKSIVVNAVCDKTFLWGSYYHQFVTVYTYNSSGSSRYSELSPSSYMNTSEIIVRIDSKTAYIVGGNTYKIIVYKR